jgi:hypothetical protein
MLATYIVANGAATAVLFYRILAYFTGMSEKTIYPQAWGKKLTIYLSAGIKN